MNEPHPIRIWKHDKNFGTKLDHRREAHREGLRLFEVSEEGIQYIPNYVDLDPQYLHSFSDLQLFLHQQQKTLQFHDYYLKFWDHHRQMFSLDEQLSSSLGMTDISDIPWDQIKLPHEHFHVNWGNYGQERFEIGGLNYVVDGAYVMRVPSGGVLYPDETLLIRFTCLLVDPSYSEAQKLRSIQGSIYSEPVYEYVLSGKRGTTVGDALKDGEVEFSRYCEELDSRLHESAIEYSAEAQVFPDGVRLTPHSDKFKRGIERIRGALPMLLNSIFYLVQRPGNRTEIFPQAAPKPRVERFLKEKHSKNKKALGDALARRGYSVVTFVRDPDANDEPNSQESNKTVRSHWRRGHWRNQLFGKNLSESKWIWIKPVLVKRNERFEIGTKHQVPKPPTHEL